MKAMPQSLTSNTTEGISRMVSRPASLGAALRGGDLLLGHWFREDAGNGKRKCGDFSSLGNALLRLT